MALGRIAHLLAAPPAAAPAAAAAPARAGGLTRALARLQAPTAPAPHAGLSRALGRLASPGAQSPATPPPPAAPTPPAAPPPSPHVDVGTGLRIVFDQAGEGALLPAWQGRILSNGQEVGWFKSDGPASTTIIQPESAVDALQAAVDASAPELSLSQLVKRENLVLTFAEAKLFAPGAATLTLRDVVLKAAQAQPAPPQALPKVRRPAPQQAAKLPTFAQARAMLLAGLRAHGWEVRAGLNIPWAASGGDRLWFKPEAIYYGTTKSLGDAHSISSDMREFATVD